MSKEQFMKEVCTLRRLWGEKDFWANPNTVDNAKKSIGFCFMNTETDNEEDREFVVSVFFATMKEFIMRAMFVGFEKPMKTITITIDERIFAQMQKAKKFRDFLDGCTRPASIEEKIVHAIVNKVDEGKANLELGVKNEPLQ